jgi:hypothetical protein
MDTMVRSNSWKKAQKGEIYIDLLKIEVVVQIKLQIYERRGA